MYQPFYAVVALSFGSFAQSESNEVFIKQLGEANQANVLQLGTDNLINLQQSGVGNVAQVAQGAAFPSNRIR